MATKNVPTNKALYARVKAEAKRKFDVYPSAYANAWLVKTYKKRGGGYTIRKMSRASGGLTKWFAQDWVDIGSRKKDGSYAKCGRKSAKGSKRKYQMPLKSKANRMTESQRNQCEENDPKGKELVGSQRMSRLLSHHKMD